MRATDESLLKSFAISRDEAAFRALADRYLGLVFHTALRRTNNRPLAEEVSQNILCALAKKASALAKNPDLLPAWLHRATLYESSKAMRSESSHQLRKQLQHPDNIAGTNTPQASPWSDAVPHLDIALDKLPESDRSLLLLHFFEDRPFPKIAQALGKNPAAVQKQSQRALAKLARILRGRGVTLTATAIAAGLTSELAKAASPTLLQSATAAVLSGSATYSTTGLTLMLAAKSKVLVPLAILLCAVPLALQQVAISSVRNHNEALRSQPGPTSKIASNPANRRPLVPANASKVSTNIDILVLVAEHDEARRSGGLKQIAFAEKLAALAPIVLVRLIDEGAVLRIQRDKKTGFLDALISALADKDTRLAVTTAIDAFPAGPELAPLVSQTQVTHHFGAWAKSDPASALTWFQEQEKSGKFNPSTLSGDSGPINAFKAPLIHALIVTNHSYAIEIFRSTPELERLSLLRDALRSDSLLADPNASTTVMSFIPVIREVFRDEMHDQALGAVGDTLARDFDGRLEQATHVFTQTNLTTEEREIIARSIADSTLGTQHLPTDPKLDAKIDAELGAWLQVIIPDKAVRIIEDARAKEAKSAFDQAEYTIDRLQKSKDLTDERLVSELMNRTLKSHLGQALELAGKIHDPEKRASVVEFLNRP